jgi:DNA-binding beta-propeller fold protein YncE
LSSAWVITSGVTYSTEYDGSTEWDNVTALAFSSSGKRCFVTDQTHDKIFEYELATAWDISTATLTRNSDYDSKDNTPHGIQIGNSNANLFIVGWENDKIYRYTCAGTAWVERGTAT